MYFCLFFKILILKPGKEKKMRKNFEEMMVEMTGSAAKEIFYMVQALKWHQGEEFIFYALDPSTGKTFFRSWKDRIEFPWLNDDECSLENLQNFLLEHKQVGLEEIRKLCLGLSANKIAVLETKKIVFSRKDGYPGRNGNRCKGCGGSLDEEGVCSCGWDHFLGIRLC